MSVDSRKLVNKCQKKPQNMTGAGDASSSPKLSASKPGFSSPSRVDLEHSSASLSCCFLRLEEGGNGVVTGLHKVSPKSYSPRPTYLRPNWVL